MVFTQPSPDTVSSRPLTSPTVPALRTSPSRSSDWDRAGTCSAIFSFRCCTCPPLRVLMATAIAAVSSGNIARKPKKVTAPASWFASTSLKCSYTRYGRERRSRAASGPISGSRVNQSIPARLHGWVSVSVRPTTGDDGAS